MAADKIRHLASVTDAVTWLHGLPSRGLCADSRRLHAGEAFIAWPGYANDARQYVPSALSTGAAGCLVEADGVSRFAFDDPRIAALSGLKAATGHVADSYYGEPSRGLTVLAVTGTNGKTSTTWWLAQALHASGRGAGVIGTLGVGVPPMVKSTGLTTPDPVTLHATFRRFLDEGLVAAAIEASSIGIVESRLAGARISVALFTNLTQDHLDFHRSMDEYWRAKAALFEGPDLQAAVINLDDAYGRGLAQALQARDGLRVITYSALGPATLCARNVSYEDGGLAMDIVEGSAGVHLRTALIGDFNVANLLAVVGGMRAMDIPLLDAVTACTRLTPVPGRMQRVASRGGEPLGVVDYAHTPDALEKALRALRPLADARCGRLWCVFGCGGNRDAGKRPQMGAIAAREADRVVVTSDNPRDEDPRRIIEDIRAGFELREGIALEVDRRRAIERVMLDAGSHDVVLIAGKGHEDYQEVAGVRHPFSDVDVAHAALRVRATS